MDVTTVNDLAHAAQALLLIVLSFVLTGIATGGAVDAIGPKASAEDGTVVKGFYRRKYAAVGGLLALAIFAIGTVVYADPKALDVAAIVVGAVSIFFAICLIFEKLPFHSNRGVAAPVEPASADPRPMTPPRTIGLMSNEPVMPAPSDILPAEAEPVEDVTDLEPAELESDPLGEEDFDAGSGLPPASVIEPDPEPVEARETVPVGLADVTPETDPNPAEVANESTAADVVESAEQTPGSGKGKSRKGKKKKKKK